MQKRRFKDINQDFEKTKFTLIKIENELNTKFAESINMACDSIVRGQLKWIPPLSLECGFKIFPEVEISILVYIKSYLMIHRFNTCEREKCGCDILYGFAYLDSNILNKEYELELNKLKNPIAIEMFTIHKSVNSGISCLSDDPLAFLKKYRFLTVYTRYKQELQSNLKFISNISKSDFYFLMENFKYNPYFWMVHGAMMLGRVPSLHIIPDTEWALSCDPFPSNFNDLIIPDWMREKINRDGNNSFKSIVDREECRKIASLSFYVRVNFHPIHLFTKILCRWTCLNLS